MIEQNKQVLPSFWSDEDGQTLVEYGLLISLIALVVIGVLTIMGRRLSNTFNSASSKIGTATG
jgi:pilus assembly protein Flp/PilA